MDEVSQVFTRAKSLEEIGGDPKALAAVKWDRTETRQTDAGGTETIGHDAVSGTSMVVAQAEPQEGAMPSISAIVEGGISYDIATYPDGRKALLGRTGEPRRGAAIFLPQSGQDTTGTPSTEAPDTAKPDGGEASVQPQTSPNLDAAIAEMSLTPQEQFLYQTHLENLRKAPVTNEDGSVSTLRQITFEQDGRTYSVPTVWGGAIHDPEEAIQRAQEVGLDRFPSYASEQEAQSRYDQLHGFMERDMPGGGGNASEKDFEDIINGLLDAKIIKRSDILPLGVTDKGDVELALPQMAIDFLKSAGLVGDSLKGNVIPREKVAELAANIVGGGLLSPKPKGAIGMAGGGVVKGAAREAEKAATELESLYSPYRTDLPEAQGIDFNMDNLDTPESVKEAIDAFSQVYAKEIAGKTGGVMPHEVTRQVADLIGTDAKSAMRIVETLPSNTQDLHVRALVMRDMLVRSAENVDQLARRVANVPSQVTDEDLLAFRRAIEQHAALQANFKGVQTDIARALSAFRIPADAGQLARAQIVQEALQATGGRGTAQQIARKWLETPLEKRAAFATQSVAAKSIAAVREIWINGLLSSARTHEVNFVSNMLFTAWQVPERALAGTIGGVRNLMPGGAADRVRMGEAPALMLGWVESVPDAFRAAWSTFRTETPADALSKIESSEYRAITAQKWGLDESSLSGRFVDLVGMGVRMPGRLLMTADEFQKAIGRRMELRAQAVRMQDEALDLGSTRDEAADLYADILAGTNAEANQAAGDFASTITFTKQLGEAGQSIQAAARKVPGMWIVVPFIRTPVNIVKEFIARTPAAPALREVREDFLAGGARRDLALAKISTGTASLAFAAHLSAQGVITGAGPSDPRMRKTWLEQYQPYSINLKKLLGEERFAEMGLENEWLPYGRLEPVGMLFGVGADIAEYRQWAPQDIADESEGEILSRAVGAVIHRVSEKSFLQGIANFAEAYSDPDRYAGRYLANIAGSMVPYSSMTRDIKNALDPLYRDTRADPYADNFASRGFQATINEWRSRTPGFSDDLPARTNFWGEPIRAYEGSWINAFNAFAPKKDKSQPIDRELIRLRYPLAMPSKQANGVKLNAERYAALVKAMNEIKAPTPAGEKAMRDYMNWLVDSPFYNVLPNNEMKIEQLRDVRNRFVDAARTLMITPGSGYYDAELAEWTRRAAADRAMGQEFAP